MEIKELRQKSKEELGKLVKDIRERQTSLRFDLVTGKVKNVREIRQIKKDIARIMTLSKERPTSERGRENPPVLPHRKILKTEGF
jgi:large subunit ribosomal protein L29